ncbi:peptidase M28 [[Phormidium ambiguum] IAM M-71]|uniref:Peptidase M28 n=1 Tax=[Phormidium ambiguum] IAM M-71 TaxID=454136 RepID=A0A1U7ISU5_9CYAN|nr:M28 family peptidase [Phormidium ambiguum]OKH40492.1 peptidase M28 [Phormidium ambiguum IAM M-71]
MKKWLWWGWLFAIATTTTIFLYSYTNNFVSNWYSNLLASQLKENHTPEIVEKPISTSKLKTTQAIAVPKVSNRQLLAHIKALDFERYEDASRSKTRDYIINNLKKSGWSPTLQTFEYGVNIVAEKPGTSPKAGTILLGAHYDTVINSSGADDNASGVATVLEVARLLRNIPTVKSLKIIFFDLEEKGLLGSFAFTNKPDNLIDLEGAIILDMVGFACHTPGCQQYPSGLPITAPSDKGDFLAVIGDAENSQLLGAFSNQNFHKLPPVVTLPIPLKGVLTPDVLRSDHAPFWLRGIGAVLITDTANFRSPHYHKPTDKPDTIDQKFFTGSAQIITNGMVTVLQNQ